MWKWFDVIRLQYLLACAEQEIQRLHYKMAEQREEMRAKGRELATLTFEAQFDRGRYLERHVVANDRAYELGKYFGSFDNIWPGDEK